MSAKAQLLARIADRSARVGIFGLGYVGLPLALRFAQAGFRVIGFDIDAAKVAALREGRSYIGHIGDARVAKGKAQGLEAEAGFARVGECDALVICVPTPLDAANAPDLQYVVATIEAIAPGLRAGQLVSLESTTYPGTTEEELAPRIAARGFTVGRDVFLAFSPEREDPGNREFDTASIPKVCGGATADCLEVACALYGAAVRTVVPVSSLRVAEMTKLLENVHRAVNIALVNELKMVADRMGIDIREVIRAAATKPFGFVAYQPGPGFGGHCIPIDPYYLSWKARQYGARAQFVELAGDVNRAMPGWVMGKLEAALAARGTALKGSRVLVLGIAYKKNIDDMRESPAVKLMELLRAAGAVVAYADPHVPVFPRMREHQFELASVALTPAEVAAHDAVLVATDHDAFDYAMVAAHARLIVDTRGVYRAPAANVVPA
jgi:UDP-N-acetyl-D-glucosamine dehydrogenase